jgi:hypothetical protein
MQGCVANELNNFLENFTKKNIIFVGMPPICDFPSQARLERNPTLKKLIFFLPTENIETNIEICVLVVLLILQTQ